MLDEPTNHLDLPAIQWFEGYLRNYQGTVIIVSHDRRFLDQLATYYFKVENRPSLLRWKLHPLRRTEGRTFRIGNEGLQKSTAAAQTRDAFY